MAGASGASGGGGTLGSSGGGSNGGAGGAGMSQAGSTGSGPSASPGPRLIGRFDLSVPSAPVFAWSGSAIALRFTGNAISVTLDDAGSNVFQVVIDVQLTTLATSAGKNKYALARALTDGAHSLLLYRRTEAMQGETTFYGFDVTTSSYLPNDPVPTRRLEVIGDSISAGYGDEGTFPCSFSAATENHYLTYEALAARALQAELHTEAWSGIGMLRNYDGSTTNTMPERFPRTLPQRSTSTWDFSAYVPDAVVINLGTNDFAAGDPGTAFETTYLQFVTDLRAHYPAARFFLAVGTMLSGDGYTQAVTYLNTVIAARAALGDKNLALLELGTQDTNLDGLGCDYHPSLKTHQKMADKLVAALQADLGW